MGAAGSPLGKILKTDDFSDSGICALCHSSLTDEAGNDVSNDAQWRSTMMANAAKDPLWQAKISSEVARNPQVQEIIKEKCSRCRMGMARYQAITDIPPAPVEVLVPGFLDPAHYLHEAAMDGVSCTLCHQVQPGGLGSVVISNRPRRLAARTPFGQHHYVGGNSFMVYLLKTNAADLGVTADAVHFDDTLSRTLVQLQENTAKLAAQALRKGDTLAVTVDVENLAGHKLPSGLPSRRCWLHVVVTDANKNTIFESGRPLAGGRIEGNDADQDPFTWEPHHDTITSADQVQIYEPIMLTYESAPEDIQVTYTLLRA
jgi:hypothetical protein